MTKHLTNKNRLGLLFDKLTCSGERIQQEPATGRNMKVEATYDDELRFVLRAAVWLVLLAIGPLLLFLILNYCYPDLLWIPAAPE